jgi:peroxidase
MAASLSRRLVVAACVVAAVALALLATPGSGQLLDPHFYDKACPAALPTIKRVVEEAVAAEPRMGASLLRLHFHDCFVNVRTHDAPRASRLHFEILSGGLCPDLCAYVLH